MKRLNAFAKVKFLQCLAALFVFLNIASVTNGQTDELHPMPDEPLPIEKPYLFYGTVAILAIGVYLYARYRSKEQQLKRSLKKQEKVSIQNFKDGQSAKIVGDVFMAKNLLLSPLTKQQCMGYHFIIEKQQQDESGLGLQSHHTVVDEINCADFFISDATGLAAIQPQGAELVLQKKTRKMMNLHGEVDERVKTILEERGLASSDHPDSYNVFRIKEGIIEIGKEISVLGQGHWEATSDVDKRKEHPKSLVFSHNQQVPLIISNDPKTFK